VSICPTCRNAAGRGGGPGGGSRPSPPSCLRSSYVCTVIGVLTVVVPGVWSDVMLVVSE
jgi:hypothetical protein